MGRGGAKRSRGGPFTAEELKGLARVLRSSGFPRDPGEFVSHVTCAAVGALVDALELMEMRDGDSLTMRIVWEVREKVAGCPDCDRDVMHEHAASA
jgi:hypothetical protein